MHSFYFGTVVTEENKDEIIAHVAQYGLNVSDDLEGIIEFYAPTGEEPMAFFKTRYDDSDFAAASFTVFGTKYFYGNYELDYERTEGPFTQAHKL